MRARRGHSRAGKLQLKLAWADLSDLRGSLGIFTALNNPPEEAGLKRIVMKFWSDESGATAIEYGLIAAGIALAIIAVVNGLGTNLNTMFSSINSSLK